MAQRLTLNLNRSIGAVVVNSGEGAEPTEAEVSAKMQAEHDAKMREIEELKTQVSQLSAALDSATGQMRLAEEQMMADNRENVASLAVEIARRILVKEVREGQYDIEAIIGETLKAVSSHEKTVVRLNSYDYENACEILKGNPESVLENVVLVSDEVVAPAHCVVETPKGVVEYYINEQLRHVAESLGGVN
jgi:flagellar biosynthesis/type III secretory pathway protein FliH